MDYQYRWEIIEELGEGGQGKVYRVLDSSKFNIEKQIRPLIQRSIQILGSSIQTEETKKEIFKSFRKAITDLFRAEDPSHHGALKVLHKPEDARDADRAEARIKREIQAMSEISHPNLIRILDADSDSRWFVSEYYPRGTLAKNLSRYAGNFPKALRGFRPLVDGVSELHKKGIVHRDIKPQNVFIDLVDNLVLGDFGLVFFTDERHTRISGTLENVGSRDWMPAWAMGMRIEDIKPSFDVFSLGKVLWSMVSGQPFLRLWYFDKARFNLEEVYPDVQSIRFANPLLRKCIVEHEEDCITDASELLVEIDKVLSIIDINADVLDPNVERKCRVCGIGYYGLVADRNPTQIRNFGLNAVAGHSFKIFTCNHCGNVQIFDLFGLPEPNAWLKK